ncbi:hypothetical protein ES705_19964 [subsurface metagenome]
MESLRLPNPLFINGPVDINPLNIATIRPVPLTIRLSTGVKASMSGVNRTPPPIPATTAMQAIAKLSRKKPKVNKDILFRDIPPGGVSAPFVISIRAANDRITTPHIRLSSSQGDLSNLLIFS